MIEAKAPYADCANCPLAAMPCVPSAKPSGDIALIVVGEAPGYYEEKRGAPFVGPSGKLLDDILEHIGIDPASVFKTNAVLCRPPSNDLARYPGALEACSERLRFELAQIPTQTIAALGATAVAALDRLAGHSNKNGIMKRRGQWYDLNAPFEWSEQAQVAVAPDPAKDKRYLATLHPAFILRSTGYISQFLTDMRSLTVDRTNARDWLNTRYTVVDSATMFAFITWLGDQLTAKERVSFDVETANLDPRSELLAIGFASTTDHAWIVPGALVRADSDLRELLTRFLGRARLVAHNGKFDQQVLANNGLGFFDLEDDTMLAHYALDEQKGTHGLKQLSSSFLGVPDYESALIDAHFRTQERIARDYSTIPLAQLYQYLAIDCCATLALSELFKPLIIADQVSQAHKIAVDASNALQMTEFWGIKIDRPYLQRVLVKLDKEIAKAEQAIQGEASRYAQQFLAVNTSLRLITFAPAWIKTIDQYRAVIGKIVAGVNLNSWQQLQVLLYDVLALKHTKKLSFKTDPRSTNAEALAALEAHPFVSVLSEYRRLAKIKGTYVEKLLQLADDNDRVHINFNIHGTETGRLSANDGLHGIPRPSDIWGRALRGAFIAAPGYKLIAVDYSQAELRCFAAESKEPFLLNAYNNDEDVHGNTTKALFPNDPIVAMAEYDKESKDWYWHKTALDTLAPLGLSLTEIKDRWAELRTLAKNTNFGGLVYLGGADGIAAMLGGKLTAAQLRPILARLLAQMPIARAWQMEQFRKARDQHYVQSRFGNKRRFLLITDDNLDEVKKASVNAPIQNSASQLTLLAGIELTRAGVRVVHYNHDQLMAEVPEDLAERTAERIKSTMERIGAKYFPEVKWQADIKIGSRWYEKRPEFEEDQ